MKIIYKLAMWQTEEGNEYDFHRFDEENHAAVKAYFDSDDDAVDFLIVNDVKELDFYYEFKDWSLALGYFLKDLKDDNSSLCRCFNPDDKQKMLDEFISCFIQEQLDFTHTDTTDYDVFYGNKNLHFRAHVSCEVLLETFNNDSPFAFEVEKLPKDEFLKGIAVWYYHELGMWDREKLRNDETEMKFLHDSWIDSLSVGLA